MDEDVRIQELEDEINDIDIKIVLLLNQRADFSTELFPLVISTTKLFKKTNRKKVLAELSKGDDPRLQIKAYTFFSNPEDKNYIKDSINLTEDIDYRFNTFDDFTSFLRDLYNSHLNDDFADMLLKKTRQPSSATCERPNSSPLCLGY